MKLKILFVAQKHERPKEFTKRQKRHITKMVKTGEAQNVPEVRRILAMNNLKVPSPSSIKSMLHSVGLYGRVKLSKPKLTSRHREIRYA